MKRTSIDTAAQQFNLPDLCPALTEDLWRISSTDVDLTSILIGGHHSASSGYNLLFDSIQVWTTMWIQLKEYHWQSNTTQLHTLLASAPLKEWPAGRYDTVLANTDPSKKRPFTSDEPMLPSHPCIPHPNNQTMSCDLWQLPFVVASSSDCMWIMPRASEKWITHAIMYITSYIGVDRS